jgi:DNA-binding GntR family transcriptional regulator
MNQHRLNGGSIDSQRIVEELKAEMALLNPGHRLVEMHLCDHFGVKRDKVRRALRQLEQEGFVRIIPNAGAVVAQFSQKDIEHTYDLLGVLEGLAARVVTPFITPKHLEHMHSLIEEMENADEPLIFDWNREFHSFLTSLCENTRLIKFADNLRDHVRNFYFKFSCRPYRRKANNEHLKIVEAIKDMKPEKVERLIRIHYLNSKKLLLQQMNKSL